MTIGGPRAALALALCAVPVAMGFVLPFGVILAHALERPRAWLDGDLLVAFWHTLTTAGGAALICTAAALFLVYAVRLAQSGLPAGLLSLASVGYAAPGAVLAVGILIPLAALDHRIADGSRR